MSDRGQPSDDGEAHPAPQPLENRFRDESAQCRRKQRVDRTCPAARHPPAASLALRDQPTLDRRLRERLVDASLELLEDARHGEHRRRPLRGEIIGELGDDARVHHSCAERQRQVVAAGPLEHVRQRQDGKEKIGRPRHAGPLARGHVGDDVAVRQHHALRPARRSGCVADRGQGPLGKFAELGRACSGGEEAGDRGSVVAALRAQGIHRRDGGGGLPERVGHARVLHDEQSCLRVGGAPRGVVWVVLDVERNDDEAQPERGQIERDPVHAIAQTHSDAVALAQFQRRQRRLPAPDQRGELIHRDVAPLAAHAMPVEHLVRRREMLLEIRRDIGHAAPSHRAP